MGMHGPMVNVGTALLCCTVTEEKKKPHLQPKRPIVWPSSVHNDVEIILSPQYHKIEDTVTSLELTFNKRVGFFFYLPWWGYVIPFSSSQGSFSYNKSSLAFFWFWFWFWLIQEQERYFIPMYTVSAVAARWSGALPQRSHVKSLPDISPRSQHEEYPQAWA